MGTSNFHNVNADNIYVIDYKNDEEAWMECQENLGEWLKELNSEFIIDDDITSEQELSSYPVSSIGYIEFEDYIGDYMCIETKFNIFLRSGYYEAANLDFEIEYLINGYDNYGNWEELDDVFNDIIEEPEEYELEDTLECMSKDDLYKTLNKYRADHVEEINKLLTKISTPYIVEARFSNGETIYKELKDK